MTTMTTSAAATMSPLRALLVLAAVLAACLGPAAADQPGSVEGYTIAGRIKIDAARGFGLPAKTSNTKVILNGGQKVTFARPDGYFAFHNVPAGTHLIEVSSLGYFFSPVRVDISARNPGHIQAALTENRRVLNELVLEPLKEEQYYEPREPFNILSLLKSPMGMMVGFMVLMVVVMPKMMENIDPEEIKQAQEQMRNSPVPSFSGLLARANS
ncbi:ER membrane protein complex subunit 7 homolog [Triticum aestivum]|uniref:ER membrane protein complex subunit 7 homolog n=1 Tax=Triticum aestivum TaxID=4565 RepID=UPI001D02B95C|nr:ER membrane protein complex subunit 7 homolog [Triticum aestivum]